VFGIGWSELVIILFVAVVLVNPKELPALARRLGGWVRKLRKLRDDFRRTFRETVGAFSLEDEAGGKRTPSRSQRPRMQRNDHLPPPPDSGSPYT
jgi:sec-independent protein translocase protein TatB